MSVRECTEFGAGWYISVSYTAYVIATLKRQMNTITTLSHISVFICSTHTTRMIRVVLS